MSLEDFKEHLIGKEMCLGTVRLPATIVDNVKGNTLYGRFGTALVEVRLNPPAGVNPDRVAVWEMFLRGDPLAAGPYADWCEEQGWTTQAELLHRLARPRHPEEAPHGHPG